MSEREEMIDQPASEREEQPVEFDQPEGSEEKMSDQMNPNAPSEVQT